MDTSVSLLDRLTASPEDADWRRLVDLYTPLLREWIARAGVTATDADDLSQDVLMVVVREVQFFERRKPGAFRAWLRVILVHRLRAFFRTRRRQPTAGSDLMMRLAELESPESALSELWNREHDEWIAGRALARVQPDFSDSTWQAFQRQVIDGQPAASVAHDLSLTLNAVLIAKSRVLKRLREEMKGLL